MIIKDKVALVTGASEGIGKEIALALAEKGSKVIAVSRNIEDGSLSHDNVVCKQLDVSKVAQVKELYEVIASEYGQLDIVVNNAGLWQKLAQLDEVDEAEIEAVLNTNLLGTILITRYGLPWLRRSDEAALVNIISKSGVAAQAGQSVYTASKYGVKGFTDVLREDLKSSSVHIMAVYQAGTNTQMFNKAGDTQMPLQDFTEPHDLAEQIVGSIAAPAKLWINELHVNYR